MKGYIYTMYRGADPGTGWSQTDPILGPVPTLGACVPNIRRSVEPGDWIFPVSGRVPRVQQYVVCGLRVAEKIDALAAYHRYPENRLAANDDGSVRGNIIVDREGNHHVLDTHSEFERRFDNFIVGDDAVALETPSQVNRGRLETLDILGEIFGRKSHSVFDAIGRWRRLDERQVEMLVGWLRLIRAATT